MLPDLIQVIHDGPEELRLAAMDRGERVRYDDIVEALQVTLNGLLAHGRLGEIFSGETTVARCAETSRSCSTSPRSTTQTSRSRAPR